MPEKMSTPQEEFWAGNFGAEYTKRNAGVLHKRIGLWARAVCHLHGVSSVIEFGANIGLNLEAIGIIFPHAEMAAVEINEDAARELKKRGGEGRISVYQTSIFDFQPKRQYDLVVSSGFLIHIHPERLHEVYNKIFQTSRRWIILAEYYNPTPLSIDYRGHKDKLFKRDFAGEMMDKFTDLRLADYGFFYHRDPVFDLDDVTWFLLEKDSN